MNVKQAVYKVAMPIAKMYWRIFKPKTFGVKVLIFHPVKQDEILVVRHSYGNTALWNIPGGGYNPKKESAEKAATREVSEELEMEICSPDKLGEYLTSGQGKIDTVTIFKARALTDQAKENVEILQWKWIKIIEARQDMNVAIVAKRAIDLLS